MVTNAQNSLGFNRVYGTSKFRGVHICGKTKKWRSQIRKDGVHHSLGYFALEIDAAKAWNTKAVDLGFAKEALNIV